MDHGTTSRLQRIGRAVTLALEAGAHLCRPGFTPLDIDELIHRSLLASGVVPALPVVSRPDGGVFGRHALVCINDVAANGVPTDRRFEPGDLVTIDTAAKLGDAVADAAVTLVVHEARVRGEHDPTPDDSVRAGLRLTELTRALTDELIARLRPGAYLADLSIWAGEWAHSNGAALAPEAIVHGLGPDLHGPPFVFPPDMPEPPAYARANGSPERVETGMVLAVEPIVVLGEGPVELETLPDGWTRRVVDGRGAAYEERTVLIEPGGARVIAGTARVPAYGPVPGQRRPKSDSPDAHVLPRRLR